MQELKGEYVIYKIYKEIERVRAWEILYILYYILLCWGAPRVSYSLQSQCVQSVHCSLYSLSEVWGGQLRWPPQCNNNVHQLHTTRAAAVLRTRRETCWIQTNKQSSQPTQLHQQKLTSSLQHNFSEFEMREAGRTRVVGWAELRWAGRLQVSARRVSACSLYLPHCPAMLH